jgi:hypothetical protein
MADCYPQVGGLRFRRCAGARECTSPEGLGGGFRVAGNHQPSDEGDVMNEPAQQRGKETYRGSAPLSGDAAVIAGADIGIGRAEV